MNALKHSFHSSSGIHSKEALFEHRGDKEDSVSIPQAEFIRRKAGKIRCLQGVRCKGCSAAAVKPRIWQDNHSVAQNLENASLRPSKMCRKLGEGRA